MSKRIRNLLILIGILVVAIGAIVALVVIGRMNGGVDADDPLVGLSGQKPTAVQPKPQAPVRPDIPVLNHQVEGQKIVAETVEVTKVVSNVAAVTVTNEHGTFSVSPREADGNMSVEAYHDLPRDADAIELLCKHLTYLNAVATPEKLEEIAAYGFDEPTATVEITYKNNTNAAIELGDEAKGTAGYYCRVVGDENETLYIIDTAIAEQFLKHGKDYIGKGLIAAPAPKVDDETGKAALFNMILTGSCRDQAIILATDTDAKYPSLTYASTMYLKQPFLRMIDSDDFYATSSAVTSLTAVGVECPYPTDEQLASYGLSTDSPYSAAYFTLAVTEAKAHESGDGTVVSHYNDREHVVLLGNKNEDGYYYAYVDNYDVVYLLSPMSVPWAELQYFDVVGKNLFIKDITTVDTATMTANGTATTFKLTHDKNNEVYEKRLKVHVGAKEYNSDDFRTLYETLLRVKRIAPKEEGASATGEALFRIQLTFNDGNETLDYAVYPMSGSRYLLVTNDGEEVAVSAEGMNGFLKQYENFLNGKPVAAPY